MLTNYKVWTTLYSNQKWVLIYIISSFRNRHKTGSQIKTTIKYSEGYTILYNTFVFMDCVENVGRVKGWRETRQMYL